jgi:spermidine synthase
MPGATLGADLWISEFLTPHDIWQHGISQVLAHRQTPFQDLYIVQSGAYGKALVLDGKWQTCTGDEFLYHEPLVHVPLVLHGNPRRVLIAGGADGGTAREALKWNGVEEIVVVDIDGDAVAACREWLPEVHQGAFDNPRVRLEIGDAYDFIADTRGWDVIIADLTDPIEEGPAYKLFTREFFELCRRAMANDGIFVNQAGSLSPPLIQLLARTVKTIGSVFPHTGVIQATVPTYGSPWGLAVASQSPIDTRPDPAKVDALLAARTTGTFQMFDGQTLLGLLQIPKYVRGAIARESLIYSLANPPKFYGRAFAEASS